MIGELTNNVNVYLKWGDKFIVLIVQCCSLWALMAFACDQGLLCNLQVCCSNSFDVSALMTQLFQLNDTVLKRLFACSTIECDHVFARAVSSKEAFDMRILWLI